MGKRKRGKQGSSGEEGSGGSLLLVKPRPQPPSGENPPATAAATAAVAAARNAPVAMKRTNTPAPGPPDDITSGRSSKDLVDTTQLPGPPSAPPSIKQQPREAVDDVCFYTVAAAKEDAIVVFCQEQKTLYISGACNISVLRGAFNVNGYRLQVGDVRAVAAPLWAPAARLHCSSAHLRPRKPRDILAENRLLSRFPLGEVEDVDASFSAAVLVEGVSPERLEWMLAAEDLLRFEDLGTSTVSAVKCGAVRKNNIATVSTAVVASSHALQRLEIDHLTLSTSWTDSLAAALGGETRKPRKILICGAKGAGKSTYMRVLINRALSVSASGAAFVIDCDVGQPEFGIPGCISLYLIREPVLSPVHLNMRPALMQFYLGDVTSKNEPAIVLDAVRQLFDRYLSEVKSISPESLRSKPINTYEILTGGAGADHGGGEVPPLIVNTDGFTRGIGAEVLLGVARIVRPAVVLQVASAKNSRIEAVEQYVAEAGGVPATSGSTAGTSSTSGGGVDHVVVEHGRPVASRVAANDLRTLRYVAYFLRDAVDLVEHTPFHQRRQQRQQQGEECAAPPPLYIKTGNLVDPTGILARRLLALRVASYPLAGTGLYRTGPHALSSSLLLAALNTSLVSVSFACNDATSESLNGGRTTRIELVSAGSGSGGGDQTDDDCGVRCSILRYDAAQVAGVAQPLLPVAGIGIVRAIDPASGYIHVAHPPSVLAGVAAASSASPHLIPVLSRGPAVPPQAITYAPTLPLHPYASSDVVGEGAASMKSRYNVKRRSQQAPRP